MGDKTPESLSMDQYFDRLRSDHSPSVLARSGRTARCKPRSRLSTKTPVSDSKRRLVFDDDSNVVRKRKVMRPAEVVDLSSSQSADENQADATESCGTEDRNKRRRSYSVGEDSNEAKISVGEEVIAARSPPQVVPFEDQNGNSCMVRPEMKKVFADHRDTVDEESRRESIARARRVRAMEQFQKDVLNGGDDWQDIHGSEVETDLDDDIFDGFDNLQMN